MRRRGIALAFADIMSRDARDTYTQELVQRMRAEAPAGYVRPSTQQLLKAIGSVSQRSFAAVSAFVETAQVD